MGNEEVAVFCQCSDEAPSVIDVDQAGLLRWVNSNPACKRNQSNERYSISRDIDAMAVIFLTDREIQACMSANRVFQPAV
jgi:hypothetical protein